MSILHTNVITIHFRDGRQATTPSEGTVLVVLWCAVDFSNPLYRHQRGDSSRLSPRAPRSTVSAAAKLQLNGYGWPALVNFYSLNANICEYLRIFVVIGLWRRSHAHEHIKECQHGLDMHADASTKRPRHMKAVGTYMHAPDGAEDVAAAGATRWPVNPRAAGVATHAEHPAHPARTAAAVAAFLLGAMFEQLKLY